MVRFEYKAVPAPARGIKAKGLKTLGDRFALAMRLLVDGLGSLHLDSRGDVDDVPHPVVPDLGLPQLRARQEDHGLDRRGGGQAVHDLLLYAKPTRNSPAAIALTTNATRVGKSLDFSLSIGREEGISEHIS